MVLEAKSELLLLPSGTQGSSGGGRAGLGGWTQPRGDGTSLLFVPHFQAESMFQLNGASAERCP